MGQAGRGLSWHLNDLCFVTADMASEDSIGLVSKRQIVTVSMCMCMRVSLCRREVCVGQKGLVWTWTILQVRQGELKSKKENRDCLYCQLRLSSTGLADTRARRGFCEIVSGERLSSREISRK